MKLDLTENDRSVLDSKNLDENDVVDQLRLLRESASFVVLDRACTVSDGINHLSSETIRKYESDFKSVIESKKITKFIPASGAATRMFKHLHQSRGSSDISELTHQFFQNLDKFAFFKELSSHLEPGIADELMPERIEIYMDAVIECLFEKMHYDRLPKALLFFHAYADEVRTSLEEHLVETSELFHGTGNKALLHFTFSEEHIPLVEKLLNHRIPAIEERFQVELNITWSHQKPFTDTIAVTENGDLFRKSDGELFFRPGGHGSLIHNLGELDADVAIIKNIDNIVPDRLRADTTLFHRALVAMLIEIQNKLFSFIERIASGDAEAIDEAGRYLQSDLGVDVAEDINRNDVKSIVLDKLNRPVRICAMVKNEGEPGGGPFWVRMQNGEISKQVVEKSQVDLEDSDQVAILTAATHFNPVNLICGLKNYHGKAFDLLQYRDMSTSFMSAKSVEGREINCLEWPGLWNGAMADWNTVFVVVPLTTFNPVKTINDLLRPEHQPV